MQTKNNSLLQQITFGVLLCSLIGYLVVFNGKFQLIVLDILSWPYFHWLATILASGLLLGAYFIRQNQIGTEIGQYLLKIKQLDDEQNESIATIKQLRKEQNKLLQANQTSYAELDLARQRAAINDIEKSQFLANMSHEVRTPLNAIMGFTELLALESQENREHLNHIHQASTYLLDLIDDILDLSQLNAKSASLITESSNLPNLIQECSNMLTAEIDNKGLELVINVTHSAQQQVMVDPRRLKQVVLNMMNNAIKYTHSGYVSLHVSIKLSDNKHWLILTFADTGDGMSEDQITDIAKPFQRFNDTEVGTGLGMTITHRLIELMHGSIDIHSTIGEGTEFIIRLPLVDPPVELTKYHSLKPAKVAEQVAQYNETVNLPSTVLVVDDQTMNTELMSHFLSRLGVAFECCHSGVEALKLFRQNEYCLILMDIRMPVLDGIETCRLMRQSNNKQTQIIAVTANAMREDRETILDAGFDNCLTKPIQLTQLREICLKVANQEQMITTNHKRPENWFNWDELLDLTCNDYFMAVDMLKQLVDALPDMIRQLENKPTLNHQHTDLLHQWIGLFRYSGANQLADHLTPYEQQLAEHINLETKQVFRMVDDFRELLVAAFQRLRLCQKNKMLSHESMSGTSLQQ